MRKLFILIIIIQVFIGCKNEQKEQLEYTSELKTHFNKGTLPAAIMGNIRKDGKVDWKAFGPSIWNGTDTINENNIFRVYSFTKAIASVAALQLVEKDLIGLDEPLHELLPEMTEVPILMDNGELTSNDTSITLRHLLTHTSGFGYDFTSTRLNNFKPENWEHQDKPRLFEPGKQWQYGTSTDWVGRLIEKVSGQDLETYIRTNISEPLEMNSTWFNVPDDLKDKIVSWGARDSIDYNQYERIPKQKVTSFNAGGGLYSSPSDYLKFLRCLLNNGKFENGRILEAKTVASLFQNQLPEKVTLNYDIPNNHPLISVNGGFADDNDTYGFAWAIENNDSEKVRPKGVGYWAGLANSYYSIDNTNGIAIVYFTQFLPFNDQESYDFYRLYEKEVYENIN